MSTKEKARMLRQEHDSAQTVETDPIGSMSSADRAVKQIAKWAADCKVQARRAHDRGSVRGLDESADWAREARNICQIHQIVAIAAGRYARLTERRY